MMAEVRVSVLIPAFNAAATLPSALRSVARQRYRNFECIVVDDGCQDNSALIVDEMARSDARFRLVRVCHRGLVSALNSGLLACRGEVVARMDADDLMHGDRLGAQLERLDRQPNLAGVGCHVRLFPRSQLTNGLRRYERWLNHMQSAADVEREAFIECPLAHPTFMFRSALVKAYGYRDRGWPEDYDLLLRLLGDGHQLGVVPRRLLLWRDHMSRLSRNDERYAIDRFSDCRAHFLARGPLAERSEYVLWGYGGTGKALRKRLALHHKRPAAIVELHEGRIGQKIFGAPVIRPHQLPGYRHHFVLVSVAGQVARDEIRQALTGMQFEEGRDYVMCA